MSAAIGSLHESTVESVSTSVALAVWSDGATVHSVLIADGADVAHEYRVCRRGRLLAQLSSLAAVEQWRLDHPDGTPNVLGLDSAA